MGICSLNRGFSSYTVKREVSEEQLRDELNKEADAEEHIEDTVIDPILSKPKKVKKAPVTKKTKKDIIESTG